ncbi:MAG: caspase family protein [Pseudomonadota bacterium]|nr:caspase family protein [Pseudomonadota bacterium]
MRWQGILFTLFLVLAVGAQESAVAAQKVALVIGNSTYKHATELKNPRNDATDLATALERLGFKVVPGFDLDKREMERKIREFSTHLSGADVALFFYAGHGLQVSGQNYLAPVDARLSDDADLDFETVPLGLVLRQMERDSKTNIVFLDACRDNPLARNLAQSMGTRSAAVGRGLARIETGVGTMIAFATQPGNVALDGTGRNSPFTAALLNNIALPGLDISQMMIGVRRQVIEVTGGKQVPWEHSSLTGQFFFSGKVTVEVKKPERTEPETGGGGTSKPNEAAQAWATVQETKSRAVLQTFIDSFPGTVYAEFAKARLKEMGPQVAAVPKPEPVRPPEPDRPSGSGASADAEKIAAEAENYYWGQGGVQKDLQRSFKLAREAAEKGSGTGMFRIAWMYDSGEGVAEDNVEAARWYKQAADKGNTAAMSNLGALYEHGEGVPKDLREAFRLYKKAAEMGHALAMSNLGMMYEFGRGTATDQKESIRWYTKSSEWGEAEAMTNLGLAYYNGRGVRKDFREAIKLFLKAADKGEADALYSLALMYEEGQGVGKDATTAASYMLRALKAGEEDSYKEMRTNANAWSVQFRRELQRLMQQEGVYSGAIDGQFGPGTIQAVEALPGR